MPGFDSQLIFSALSIVLIDILLAGDNAVVIAMAVQSLPLRERRIGIAIGAGVAVVLRVVLTFFASQLLQVSFVKLIGGALILWIGVKLLTTAADAAAGTKEAQGLWRAIWYIMIADITMSTDNILAVAAASKGHLGLLIFGLGLSIPFVVFTSNLLSGIMDRFPVVVWIGAAILGRVGGEMMITDPFVERLLHPAVWVEYAVQAVCAVGVLLAGKAISRRHVAATASYAD